LESQIPRVHGKDQNRKHLRNCGSAPRSLPAEIRQRLEFRRAQNARHSKKFAREGVVPSAEDQGRRRRGRAKRALRNTCRQRARRLESLEFWAVNYIGFYAE